MVRPSRSWTTLKWKVKQQPKRHSDYGEYQEKEMDEDQYWEQVKLWEDQIVVMMWNTERAMERALQQQDRMETLLKQFAEWMKQHDGARRQLWY